MAHPDLEQQRSSDGSTVASPVELRKRHVLLVRLSQAESRTLEAANHGKHPLVSPHPARNPAIA